MVYFNPRSLTGATYGYNTVGAVTFISIHAPSRERPQSPTLLLSTATISIHAPSRERPFFMTAFIILWIFQSTLPHGSDGFVIKLTKIHQHISIHAPSRERQHQNKILLYSFKSSIFCELAQLKYSKIYFDVRKLIVSHSSLSCEPKLNFMFHITSHHEPKLHKR